MLSDADINLLIPAQALELAARDIYASVVSRAEDLDMIKGISDFENQQTGYQAALQTYASVQKLSLFNYIG